MAGDPYWLNTQLLLHCDGANGSTSIVDATGKTVTPAGNAQISTSQSKFGGASLVLDGAGDYLQVADQAGFELGGGDFTIEAWVRLSAYSPSWGGGYHAVIAAKDASGARGFSFNIIGTAISWSGLAFYYGGSSLAVNAALNLNTWYHVAVSRNGAELRFFIDGVQQGATQPAAFSVSDVATPLTIGANSYSGYEYYLPGYVDEFRFTKGVGRYAANFTPQTDAHPSGLMQQPEAALRIVVHVNQQPDAALLFEVAHTIDQPEAALAFGVFAFGQPEAALLFEVAHTLHQPQGAILITVVGTAQQAEAALLFQVSTVTRQPAAALRIQVRGVQQPEAPTAFAVTDGLTRAFGVRVLLDGEDVSVRARGPVTVRAEEGAARIASLALRAPTGPINPIAYTGRTVQIDLLRIGVPLRLFTGRVDLPAYDPNTRTLSLACTDDLQNRVAALTRAQIDALTGGGYHRAVHGEIDDHWDYAQACMLTRAASLDAGPHGGLRVTDWHDLPVWRVYDLALDQSLDIELPRRAEIVNRVDVTYAYRYHRLRQRDLSVSWNLAWFHVAAEAAGYQYPDIASCQSALGGAGWTLASAVFYPAPSSVPYAGGTVTPSGEVGSLSASLWQRHGQTVTETTSLTVTAPESVAGNGEIARELRCTLASEWTPETWESDPNQAPTNAGAGLDWAPDATRADAEAGMQAALDQARTLILARHRDTRVSYDLPCTPEIDLDRALTLATDGLTATGKVAAVEHHLDPAAGSAITRVSLAISGVAAAGLATPTVTPLQPPTPPDIDAATGPDAWGGVHVTTLVASLNTYDDAVSGWIIDAPEKIQASTGAVDNPWYTGETYPETGFRIALPGVPDSHRAPLYLVAAAAYEIAIPEDPLTIN